MNTGTFQRLYSSIDNKITAKKTIVIARTVLLIAVGPITQNCLNRYYIVSILKQEQKLKAFLAYY